jgi:phenylacetate-CoA ligase
VPSWLAERAIPALYEAVTGHQPWSALRRLRDLQWQPAGELETRALDKLRSLLAHARAHVPYYRDLLSTAGFDPADLRSLSDLSRVPVTRKADLLAAVPTRVLAANLPARRRGRGSTAGSTGMPLRFYTDRAGTGAWVGSYLLFREWAGVQFGSTLFWIPGPAHASVAGVVRARLRATAARLALGERMVCLSDFEPDARELRGEVARRGATGGYGIWGFPSYIARIAAELIESGDTLRPRPRAVVSYAETLSLLNRRAIERAFGCPVVNHYSSWEVLHLAQSCPDNPEVLHVNSERAIVRVVRADGAPAPPGEPGRVVVTDLVNRVMPFINYEIGDWAVSGNGCPCGRGFPTLASIEGRLGERIRTPSGRTILPIALCRFLNIVARAHPYLWEYQVVQHEPGEVVFTLVPTPRFTRETATRLREQIERFLGPEVRVSIEAVARIAAEPSGKRLLVKSTLPDS